MVLQERQQGGLVVFARLQIAQRVPLRGVHLQLVGLIQAHQRVHQLRRVVKVHVLVDQAVDDQQSILPASKRIIISSPSSQTITTTYSSGNLFT